MARCDMARCDKRRAIHRNELRRRASTAVPACAYAREGIAAGPEPR